jgi:hypothetical protein
MIGLSDAINLTIENKEFFGLVISFLALVVPLWQYINSKKKEQRLNNFTLFHGKVIKVISNMDSSAGIGLYDQIAGIWELRNFPEYYPVIKRLLEFCIKKWERELNEKPHFDALIQEAKITLEYINRNFVSRFCIKLHDRYWL